MKGSSTMQMVPKTSRTIQIIIGSLRAIKMVPKNREKPQMLFLSNPSYPIWSQPLKLPWLVSLLSVAFISMISCRWLSNWSSRLWLFLKSLALFSLRQRSCRCCSSCSSRCRSISSLRSWTQRRSASTSRCDCSRLKSSWPCASAPSRLSPGCPLPWPHFCDWNKRLVFVVQGNMLIRIARKWASLFVRTRSHWLFHFE